MNGYIQLCTADRQHFELSPSGHLVWNGASIEPTWDYDDETHQARWRAIKPCRRARGLFGETIEYFEIGEGPLLLRRIRPADESPTRILGREWFDLVDAFPEVS